MDEDVLVLCVYVHLCVGVGDVRFERGWGSDEVRGERELGGSGRDAGRRGAEGREKGMFG